MNKHIDVGVRVIDSNYTGEMKAILFNHGNQNFGVNMGDRIAQLILDRIETPVVPEVQTLTKIDRGEGGFGSTRMSEKISQKNYKNVEFVNVKGTDNIGKSDMTTDNK